MNKLALWTAAGLIAMGGLAGCKNDNLFGGLHEEGTGDARDLIADADAALANQSYAEALDYYTKALAQEPNNSDALYGASIARMGSSGLNIGQLIANLINSNQAGVVGGFPMQLKASAISPSAAVADPNSLLYGVVNDLDAFIASLDDSICWLERIRAGGTMGGVGSDSASLNVNLGILRFLRAAAVPVKDGLIDVRVEGSGGYEIVVLAVGPGSVPDGTVDSVAGDIMRGYQCLLAAAQKLRVANDATLAEVKADVSKAFSDLLLELDPEASAGKRSEWQGRDIDTYEPPAGWGC